MKAMFKKIGLSAVAVPVLLLGLAAAHPAQARSHWSVQFGAGYPVYSYPYYSPYYSPYEYGYYGYPYAPYYSPGYVTVYPHDYWGGRHGHFRHYDHDRDWR